MTLFALIFLCAGNCADWHKSDQLLTVLTRREDCETRALNYGMPITTMKTEPVPCDEHVCSAINPVPHPVPPYVEYAVCRQLAFFGGNLLTGESR